MKLVTLQPLLCAAVLILAATADGYAWRYTTPPGCDAACGDTYQQPRDVACIEGGTDGAVYGDNARSVLFEQPVSEALCNASTKPGATAPCASQCFFVSVFAGDDNNTGNTSSAPLRTVEECLTRIKALPGTPPSYGWSGSRVVRKCLLAGGVYQQTASVTGLQEVAIEPQTAEDDVLFDGTDDITPTVSWHSDAAACPNVTGPLPPNVMCAAVTADRAGALVVDGESVTCDERFEKDLCFSWNPVAAWARVYSRQVAERCFAQGNASSCNATLPYLAGEGLGTWFWYRNGTLFVDREARSAALGRPWPPAVRIKVPARQVAFHLTDYPRGVLIKGIRFRAATVWLWSHKNTVSRLAVTDCRFLYAPLGTRAATVAAYTGKSRGAGYRVWVERNVFEFGEGGIGSGDEANSAGGAVVFFNGAGSIFQDNYFAFNSYASRQWLMIEAWSKGESLRYNTALYNADFTFFKPQSSHADMSDNLVVGANWRGPWKDSAYFHMMTNTQWHAKVQRNWLLGPSRIKALRLDTAKTTTYDQVGKLTTITHNVWLGAEPTTIKGDNHTVMHNTGDWLQVVWGWQSTPEMNRYTRTEYNAVPDMSSRNSPMVNKSLPGNSRLNACSNLYICDPTEKSTALAGAGWLPTPDALRFQLRSISNTAALCELLRKCWVSEGAVHTGTQNGQESGEKDMVGSWGVPQVPPFDWDFRPLSNATALQLGAPANVTGGPFDTYIGAYNATAAAPVGSMPGWRNADGSPRNEKPPLFNTSHDWPQQTTVAPTDTPTATSTDAPTTTSATTAVPTTTLSPSGCRHQWTDGCPAAFPHALEWPSPGTGAWFCYKDPRTSGPVCSYQGSGPTPDGKGSWKVGQSACPAASCNVCPPQYNASADCGTCVAGYEAYPSCYRTCTMNRDCAGHATAVNGNVHSGCHCGCANQWTGSNCSTCDVAKYNISEDTPLYDGARKKGICIHHRTQNWPVLLRDVKPFWSYSWGGTFSPEQPEGIEFVPMQWCCSMSNATIDDLKARHARGEVKYLLGYNEPDSASQANMPVERALELWPQLEATGIPLVSPSPVHFDNAWTVEFMTKALNRSLRIDYIGFHSYGGLNAAALLTKLDHLYVQYGLPIWITEFAVADWNAATREANRFSPAQVLTFMQSILPELDQRPHIAMYAWYTDFSNKALWPSALFDAEQRLTPLGEWYAQHAAKPIGCGACRDPLDGSYPTCSSSAPTPVPTTDVPPTPAPTMQIPPTPVPATDVPPTPVPETGVPPTPAQATDVPPTTDVPTTDVPPTLAPMTDAPPTPLPATDVPPTQAPQTGAPPTPLPATSVPPTPAPMTDSPPTPMPATTVPPTPAPVTDVPSTPSSDTGSPPTPVPSAQTPPTLPGTGAPPMSTDSTSSARSSATSSDPTASDVTTTTEGATATAQPTTTATTDTPTVTTTTVTAAAESSTTTKTTGTPAAPSPTVVTGYNVEFKVTPTSPKNSTEFADALAKKLSKELGRAVNPKDIDVTSFDGTTGKAEFTFVGQDSDALNSEAAKVTPSALGLSGMTPKTQAAAPAPSSPEGDKSDGVLLGIVFGTIGLLLIAAVVGFFATRKSKSTRYRTEMEGQFDDSFLGTSVATMQGEDGAVPMTDQGALPGGRPSVTAEAVEAMGTSNNPPSQSPTTCASPEADVENFEDI